MQPCLDDFRTTFDDYAEMQTYHARQTRESKWARKTVSSLHRATGRKLHERSIHTIGQLANTDPRWLRSWFGKWGDVLYTFANGEDRSPVAQAGDETIIKSIGNSTTTPRDLVNEQDASVIFYMLAESVAERLRDHGFLARTVQISLRDNGLFSFERQCKLSQSTCLSGELHTAAMKLLRANYNWVKGFVRHGFPQSHFR